MTRLALVAALCALALGVAACDVVNELDSGIDGSGTPGTALYEPTGFQSVVFGSEGTVRIELGELPRVEVTTDDNLLDSLEVRSDGNTLFLETEDGVNIDPTDGVEWVVTTPSLVAVTLAGAGDMAVPPLSVESFEVRLSGAGNLTLTDITATSLSVTLNGAGNVIASGSAETLTVQLSGAGDVNALDLVAAAATVVLTGAGDAEINATGTLDAEIPGAGSIRYTGGAEVAGEVTGVGSIEPVG